jgi:hypothetical protein
MIHLFIPNFAARSCFWISGIVALLLGILPPSHAQTEISRYTVDGGGGTSEGGTSAISGTIGQPDAGVLSGGNIELRGGFWVGVAGPAPATFTPTPTPSTPLATPTSTPTPTGTGVAATPTRTSTPAAVETGLDVKPDPLDEFIDALDMIEWVSRVKNSDSSPGVFFELSIHWIREYPPSVKNHELSE